MHVETVGLDPRLAPFAAKAVLIRFPPAAARKTHYRMLPSGIGRLVYRRISGPASLRGRIAHSLFAIGPYRRLVDCPPGLTELIGIEAHPGALGPLAGLDASKFKDDVLPLARSWGRRFANDLLRKMAEAPDLRARWQLFHQALVSRLDQMKRPDGLVMRGVEQIHLAGGSLRIEELALRLQCLPRRLLRSFEKGLGLSPKQYCQIVRARLLLEEIIPTLRPRLSILAQEYGYHDQSHAIRDFKAMMGMTPGEFRAAASVPAFIYNRALDVIQTPLPEKPLPFPLAMRWMLVRLIKSAYVG